MFIEIQIDLIMIFKYYNNQLNNQILNGLKIILIKIN